MSASKLLLSRRFAVAASPEITAIATFVGLSIPIVAFKRSLGEACFGLLRLAREGNQKGSGNLRRLSTQEALGLAFLVAAIPYVAKRFDNPPVGAGLLENTPDQVATAQASVPALVSSMSEASERWSYFLSNQDDGDSALPISAVPSQKRLVYWAAQFLVLCRRLFAKSIRFFLNVGLTMSRPVLVAASLVFMLTKPFMRLYARVRVWVLSRAGYLLPIAVAAAARAGAHTFARAHRISMLVRGEFPTWADRMVAVRSIRRTNTHAQASPPVLMGPMPSIVMPVGSTAGTSTIPQTLTQRGARSSGPSPNPHSMQGVALLESTTAAVDMLGSLARALARGAARVQAREARREEGARGRGSGTGGRSESGDQGALHVTGCNPASSQIWHHMGHSVRILPDVSPLATTGSQSHQHDERWGGEVTATEMAPGMRHFGHAKNGQSMSGCHGVHGHGDCHGLGGAKCPVCFEVLRLGEIRGPDQATGSPSMREHTSGEVTEEQPACAYPCGHVLCWECGVQWASRKGSCPMCRSPATVQSLLALHG